MTGRGSKWGIFALCGLLLAPLSQTRAELKLVDVRPTYGRLGSTRPTTRVLPGDDLSVTYLVSGISQAPDGHAEISRAAELVDETGEVIAQVPANSARLTLALGGDGIASHMHFGLPQDFPPGKYLVRGLLTDVRTGEKLVVEQRFEVGKLDFGIVRLRLAADAEGTQPIGGNLTVNQDVHVVARGIGFAREGNRIHVVGNMVIRDATSKSTLPAPIAFEVDQEVDNDVSQLDIQWSFVANRPGRYTVHIEMRDELADKRETYELPIVVSPPPVVEKKGR